MNFKNMKVANKLMLGFAVLILIFVMFAVWLQFSLARISADVVHVRDESVVFALYAKDMSKDVTQVQQFLSDISATRAQDGLSDGFDEAKKYHDSFNKNLLKFQELYSAEGDEEGLKKTKALKLAFSAFYETGIKMAQAYIDGGPASGNRLMGGFDKASLALQASLAPFVQDQIDEMKMGVDRIETVLSTVKKIAMLAGFAFIVIALIAAYQSHLKIAYPLKVLQATISDVEKSYDFTRRVEVNSDDEVGQAGQAFNRLMDSLREVIKRTRTAVGEISEASQGLASSAKQGAEGSHLQADATSTAAAATEEVSVAISEISTRAEESGEISERGSRETQVVLDITRSGMKDMERTALAIRESTSNVARLSERSGKISGIVTAIKEIADQTNLLALNAAIEAARAGEQGRGFAVVADEVRKLAERTGNSTEEIEQLITSIQQEIGSTSAAMKAADEQASRSVESTRQAENALEKIGAGGEQINERVKEIALSIKESDVAIHDIANQVEKIAQMTEENQAITQVTEGTAGQLNSLAQELNQLVEKFKV